MTALAWRAAELAAWGLHVFPVEPGGKRPCIERWEERATADPEHAAAAWGERWPGCNIGIACGPSHLVVLDLDVPKHARHLPAERRAVIHGEDADGTHWLAKLCTDTSHPWPGSFTVRTPSGGLHLYFAAIPGRAIRNSASKIAPRIDVRGAGGYVVGPGSIVDGLEYSYLSAAFYDSARLPAWLADLADPPARQLALSPDVDVVQPRREAPRGGDPAYATAALVGEINRVLQAPAGTRNHALNRAAFALGQLVAAGHIREDDVIRALAEAAARAGLDRDPNCGPMGIARTIHSGLRAGASKPRTLEAAS